MPSCAIGRSLLPAGVSLTLMLLLVAAPHTLQLLTDNVTDSWMLVPVLLCFFTPSFITNIGCVYAGLVVPSLNSIKVRYFSARRGHLRPGI